MAIFKLPGITTAQRTGLVLGERELVYDTDLNLPFQGDGVTAGGVALGGGGGATNLAWVAAASTVTSDTGTDAVLTVADGTNPGLMSSAEFTKLAGITGTNTGDQTSIAGITGTKAQFDTAVTDGNFMYVGDAPTAHTHLLAAGATDVTMTAANLNTLDDGVNTALHFHDADRARANHTGTQSLDTTTDSATRLAMTAAERTKLTGIATGATANATDASLRDRATHTGTQTAATISDFNAASDARIGAASINALADVVITAASTGQVLKYNGTNWINDTDATGGGGGGFTNTVVALVPAVDQQDWTITGKTAYTTVLASPADNSWIGGVTGGASGDVLHLQNASASGLIWLVSEDAASTAANRLSLQRAGVFLLPGETATLIYNATAARWVEVAVSFDVMQVDDKVTLTLPLTAATVQNMGVGGTSITATASTLSTTATPTNDFTEGPRTQITNATANGSSDVRCGLTNYMRGATARRQGIFHNSRVAFTALGATGGVAVGLTSSAGSITTQPQATNNTIYLCANGGQTTLRISVRDASAGTPIDLGANFPVPSATAAYEVAFLCMPNVANVRYMVRRLDSDFRAQGTVTANLPANTQALGHRIQIMVGATASASTAQFTRMLTRSVS